MARRRFSRFARKAVSSARRYGRRVGKSRFSGRGGGFKEILNEGMWGAGYGFARPYAANLVSPLSNMLPLGDNKDEAALGLLGCAGIIWGRGFIKEAGRTAVKIESYNLVTNNVYGNKGTSGVSSF